MADDVNIQVDEKLDDDEPVRLEPNLPPEIASPLAPFKGKAPPSPKWFQDALARAPERRMIPVEGANIELLTWGEVGKPGLIFVHGNSAHADWWSFIAPFFADDYRVAAVSLSGMGASDWRETYTFEGFATEIFECAKAAGLYEAAEKPIYLGHSFGGSQVFYSGARHPERMKAALLIDTGFGGPPTAEQMQAWREQAIKEGRIEEVNRMGGMAHRSKPNRVYATMEEALTRFRFMPPQVPGNLFVADYIARHSLKRAPMPDGSGEGWTWRFDPFLWGKLNREGMAEAPTTGLAPMAHIYGDQSNIIKRHHQMPGGGRDMIPPGTPQIVIPDSEHHIMVDQPLALVAAIRALLACWPSPA
ncbi:MAG TPA: alpha/beta hydrolase [Caulobacteraceae bacterium]|nr:alpha/beta hydrolase [Caulobacteraceae bacterium]